MAMETPTRRSMLRRAPSAMTATLRAVLKARRCLPSTVAEHSMHIGTIDCSACHMQTVISCYNCHIESLVDSHVKVANTALNGFVLLMNRVADGKVGAGFLPVGFVSGADHDRAGWFLYPHDHSGRPSVPRIVTTTPTSRPTMRAAAQMAARSCLAPGTRKRARSRARPAWCRFRQTIMMP